LRVLIVQRRSSRPQWATADCTVAARPDWRRFVLVAGGTSIFEALSPPFKRQCTHQRGCDGGTAVRGQLGRNCVAGHFGRLPARVRMPAAACRRGVHPRVPWDDHHAGIGSHGM